MAALIERLAGAELVERTRHFAIDDRAAPRWVDSLWVRRHESLPVVLEPA